MTILKRKFVNKSGNVIVYEYDTKKTDQTNAKLKRKCLIDFINEHQTEINELTTKKQKIEYVKTNIDKAYTFSDSMIYKYLPTSNQ